MKKTLKTTFNVAIEVYIQITDADDMHKDEFYNQINRKMQPCSRLEYQS